jgi:hypothetical protein
MNEQMPPAVTGPVEPTVMQRDETLEALSDKVRKGEPIGFLEAIAVVNYQENLRREREANTLVARLKRWLLAA